MRVDLPRFYALLLRLRAPRFFPTMLLAGLVSLIGGASSPVAGQWRQADGQVFGGGGNYWGSLFGDLASNLCGPLSLASKATMVIGGVMVIWYMYKGGRGDNRAWKMIPITIVVMTFMMSPLWWLDTLGLSNLALLKHWRIC